MRCTTGTHLALKMVILIMFLVAIASMATHHTGTGHARIGSRSAPQTNSAVQRP